MVRHPKQLLGELLRTMTHLHLDIEFSCWSDIIVEYMENNPSTRYKQSTPYMLIIMDIINNALRIRVILFKIKG